MAMREQLKWHDEKADNSPWLDALAELRQRATREGHCYQHVQAITVAIDQYAEKALGNRDYFLTSLMASDSLKQFDCSTNQSPPVHAGGPFSCGATCQPSSN
jgi:hypothetical protein